MANEENVWYHGTENPKLTRKGAKFEDLEGVGVWNASDYGHGTYLTKNIHHADEHAFRTGFDSYLPKWDTDIDPDDWFEEMKSPRILQVEMDARNPLEMGSDRGRELWDVAKNEHGGDIADVAKSEGHDAVIWRTRAAQHGTGMSLDPAKNLRILHSLQFKDVHGMSPEDYYEHMIAPFEPGWQ